MKKNYLLSGMALLGMASWMPTINAQTVSDFENLTLQQDTFWNGADHAGGFSSGDAYFPNFYDTSYGGYWSTGFAYSNMKDSTTVGFTHLYSAITASGVDTSSNYVIGQNNAIIQLSGTAKNKPISGVYVTNNTYAALSMRDGDAIAKQFGGTSGNDYDWFLLTIVGYSGGAMVNDSVKFYLADYRFSNNSQDYITMGWEWVDLSGLGSVDSVRFLLTSSDTGIYGMNTPAFFCLDNFNGSTPVGVSTTLLQTMELQVYPNPVQETIFIKLADKMIEKNVNLSIFNMEGKLVQKQSFNNSAFILQIDIFELKKGMYIVKVADDNMSIFHTFIKK